MSWCPMPCCNSQLLIVLPEVVAAKMDDDADKGDDGDQTPMKAKRKCPGVSSESHISLAKRASQYSNVFKKN